MPEMPMKFEPKMSGKTEGSIKDLKGDLGREIISKKIAKEVVDFLNVKINEFYDDDEKIDTGEAMGICIHACTETMAAIFATLADSKGAMNYEERKKFMLEGVHIVQEILEKTAVAMMDKNEAKRKS